MKVRHYKGGIYTIITNAKHTEEEYDLVVYRDEIGNIWARPADMFWGKTNIGCYEVDRFTIIDESMGEDTCGN